MIFSRKDKPAMPDMDAYTLSRQGSNSDEGNNPRIEQLEMKVERLTALVETLWSILESKSSLNQEHLKKRLGKILELREGRSVERNSCQKCQQKNPVTKSQCIYCGTPMPKPEVSQENPFNF